jgi:hypothetical protein
MPEKKNSKKYKTYLGLVDSGSSGPLGSRELVECANFNMKLNKKSPKWDTATGLLQMDGMVQIEKLHLTSVLPKALYHHVLSYVPKTFQGQI